MKILEPVEQSAIPSSNYDGTAGKYEELYERVLSLKGKALPIEFEDVEGATKMAHVWRVRSSACYRRGIRVQKRGNVIYLSKRP